VDDERDSVARRLIADGVRSAAGQRHRLTGLRGAALHVPVHVLYVEGELAVDDVVDLARIMSMHHRRTAAGVHPEVDGEERAVGLGAGGHDDGLLRTDCQSFMAIIDR